MIVCLLFFVCLFVFFVCLIVVVWFFAVVFVLFVVGFLACYCHVAYLIKLYISPVPSHHRFRFSG